MSLSVKILGPVGMLPLFLLRQSAEFPLRHRLLQHIAANQPPCQFQYLPQCCCQGAVRRQLSQDQLRFQGIQTPPELDSGVGLSHQHIPVQMGHMLRFFFGVAASCQPVAFRPGQGSIQDFDPLLTQPVPGAGG